MPLNSAFATDPTVIRSDTTPSNTGTATSSDSTATITFTDVSTAGTGNVIEVITRTWTATDTAGNQSSEVQIITIKTQQQSGKVMTSGAQLDKNTNFGFYIKSTDKKTQGAILYKDKTANITLVSHKMIDSSITQNTNAVFTGTGKIYNVSGYTFDVTIQDNGIGKTDYFSIKIKDSAGNTIYTKEGLLYNGNIKISTQ